MNGLEMIVSQRTG